MKSIAVFAFLVTLGVFVAARPNDFEAKFAEDIFTCMKEHNLKLEDFRKFKKDQDLKPEDVSKDMKCAVHCITQKMGAMDENGKMKPDEIKALLTDDEKPQFEEAFKECNEISGADACETAFLTFGCMEEHKLNHLA